MSRYEPGPLSPPGTLVAPQSRKTVLITSSTFLRLSLQFAQARVFTVSSLVADNVNDKDIKDIRDMKPSSRTNQAVPILCLLLAAAASAAFGSPAGSPAA